jgi:hypothetical protein
VKTLTKESGSPNGFVQGNHLFGTKRNWERGKKRVLEGPLVLFYSGLSGSLSAMEGPRSSSGTKFEPEEAGSSWASCLNLLAEEKKA